MSSLYELCAHTIVKQITVYDIERLPLPQGIKENLKSYALTNYSTLLRQNGGAPQYKSLKKRHKFRAKTIQTPADAVKTDCVSVSRKSCVVSWCLWKLTSQVSDTQFTQPFRKKKIQKSNHGSLFYSDAKLFLQIFEYFLIMHLIP